MSASYEELAQKLAAAEAVVAAVRDVMPQLRTSHEPADAVPAVFKPRALALREEADRIEAQDAAVFRIRRALAEYDGRDPGVAATQRTPS